MLDLGYRLWLVKYLLGVFVPPAIALWAACKVLAYANPAWNPGALLQVVGYLLFPPIFWDAFSRAIEWRDSRTAKKLGAKTIPLITGKRFANIDSIARWSKGITQGYVGQIVDDILDDAGVDTARISMFGVDRIITRDHDVAKFVLSTGFSSFEKGEAVTIRAGSFFGRGIFTSDGERAKMHRALARPYFARERISDFHSFHNYTEKMVSILLRSSDSPIDVQDIFARFTMDTAGEFLFGTSSLNTMDLPLPKAGQAVAGAKGTATGGAYGSFVNAFDEGNVNIHRRLGKPQVVWSTLEFFKDGQAQAHKAVDAYLEEVARGALSKKRMKIQAATVGSEDDSFLDHLARSTDDVELVKDQLLAMMIAARDTTACLLSFTCYLLARSPGVLTKLRQEILASHGSEQVPSYDSMRNLKYR